MKDSVVGDAWIAEMARTNPPTKVLDPTTGQWNGNIRVFVRLAFTDALFVAERKMKSDPNSKIGYGCVLLFPPMTDMTLLYEEYNRVCASDFANTFNPHTQQYQVHSPFRNCSEKPNFAGYTPGCYFTTVGSSFKPPVVDPNNNPIVDPARAHSGVWAIVAINTYASGKGQPNKGPRFGLQTVMIVADDTSLAGAPPDPRQQFAGVNFKPPTVQPSQHFGQLVATQPPTGGVGSFYPPGAPQQPPGLPPPQQPAYAPPVQHGTVYPPGVQLPPGAQPRTIQQPPGAPPPAFDPNQFR
jgi:hypothetical protein